MRIQSIIPLTALIVQALTFLIVNKPSAGQAETIWSGSNTNFSSANGDSDVLIPDAVAIQRAAGTYLYNPFVDVNGPDTGTPSDIEWAFGTMANHNSLNYKSFSALRDDIRAQFLHLWQALPNKPMVMHLINEDIYISVMFTAWGSGGSSLFTYTRSTPNAVAPPPTPTVSITTPTNNAVFADPANVTITANATVSTGSVTNVLFFGNANSLGSKDTGPFTITANGLGVGSYSLTAVATAGGISATSAPVTINIVAPVNTSLSAAVATLDNQFVFSYSTTPGLRYEVDISSNLFNWTPVSTNVATGNPSFFTNPISGGENFYRVGRLPNP